MRMKSRGLLETARVNGHQKTKKGEEMEGQYTMLMRHIHYTHVQRLSFFLSFFFFLSYIPL